MNGVFRYVRHRHVERFLAAGWWVVDDFADCHHGRFSVLMKACECNPEGAAP
jgi:hypothetical protein